MRVPPPGDAPIHDAATIRDSWDDDAERITRRVHAAMQSPGTKAVVAVVLDVTETLRAEVERQRTAADSARAAIANVVRILPADRHALVAAGRVRDALFTPGPSLTVQHIREEHPEQEQT